MNRPLISYNGEMMTKKAMIRIFTLANPTLRPIEIQKKILADTGISVADNTVSAIVKTIRGCSAKPQKSHSGKVKTVAAPEVQEATETSSVDKMNLAKGLQHFKISVKFLGVSAIEELLSIYKR